jgi:hypothetical protein
MNNIAPTYQLAPFSGLMSHGWSAPSFLRDADTNRKTKNETDLSVDVQVRSGDYFVTLATTLDLLGKNVDSWRAKTQLEDLVSDLIYLQDNYTIIKND